MRGNQDGAPFGTGWELKLSEFARWVAAGAVFGAMNVSSRTSDGERSSVDPDAVSATLGWLYLDQGHLDDAEAVFHQVRHRSPGDARAREGLDRLETLRRSERRVARLERFLDRVRASGD